MIDPNRANTEPAETGEEEFWRQDKPAGRSNGNGRARKTVDLDPENLRRGMGQLVLTLVKLVQELLERQALRRMEAGSLTDEEIERLGRTFKALHAEMADLKKHYGLTDDQLNLDLGPLGKLF
ncbi:MAG: gas vesicle protein K [Verrucomicrobia bacterium]|nr:gas vesicle protein K [Verrucomicrobiota bacterium]